MANTLADMTIGVRDYVAAAVDTALGITPIVGAPRLMPETLPYALVSMGRVEFQPSTITKRQIAFEVIVGVIYDIPATTDSESFLMDKAELLRAEIDSDPHADANANLCQVTAVELSLPEETHGDRGQLTITVAALSDVNR